MSQGIQVFAFDSQAVRTITKEGEPWWIARDVCAILGLGNVTEALRNLDDDERGSGILNTPGGPQEMTVISEPGLYSLILRSRKPEARQFRRWITHEVIPAIRRTGAYDANNKKLTALLERYGDAMTAEARSQLVLTIAGIRKTAPKGAYVYMSPLTKEALEGARRYLDEAYPSRPVEVSTKDMYAAYPQWCADNDVPALPSINSFAHAIGRLGHKKVTLRPDVGMVVKGWRLLADEDEKSPGE